MTEKTRIRVRWRRGDDVKYLSHLDLMRLWLRAVRRAGLPLAYSEGFSPHPRISTALPLPVGVIGEAELLDIDLRGDFSPDALLDSLRPELPPAVEACDAWVAQPPLVALPKIIEAADYLAEVETSDRITDTVAAFLATETWPFERTREGKTKQFDLRPLVDRLEIVESTSDGVTLSMRLVANNTRSGRVDDLLAALGLGDCHAVVRRTALAFSQPIR